MLVKINCQTEEKHIVLKTKGWEDDHKQVSQENFKNRRIN